MRKGKHMEIDTWFGNYVNVANEEVSIGKTETTHHLMKAIKDLETKVETLEDENAELKTKIENLEEENTSLKEKLEKQEALVTALDDIQHWLNIIRDVFYDLNKQDIYRNNF